MNELFVLCTLKFIVYLEVKWLFHDFITLGIGHWIFCSQSYAVFPAVQWKKAVTYF